MPEEGTPLTPSSQLLSANEVEVLTRLFCSQGVNKVRLTGGEPLVRKDLVDIVSECPLVREDLDLYIYGRLVFVANIAPVLLSPLLPTPTCSILSPPSPLIRM